MPGNAPKLTPRGSACQLHTVFHPGFHFQRVTKQKDKFGFSRVFPRLALMFFQKMKMSGNAWKCA